MHVGWEVAPAMAATYHEPQWHMPQIKAEIQDMPISEGFHSGDSSLSRDSHPNSPQSVDSGDQLYQDNNPYNTVLQYRHSMQFNPLTPPGFDHPKLINYHLPYHMKSNMNQYPIVSPAYRHKDISNNLTPSYTPPLNVTPPKSPRSSAKTPDNTAHSDSGDNENCDNIQRMDMLQDNMKESSNDSGDEAKSDVEDESELRTPRVNSHGKVKTFKCKQCEFVAVTKMDFWEHSKVHIKPEKMLKCLRCPFVTEYKHHLEYHLRNHAGSKPFQCDKCNYNCVNKSMLNSHLKSHSNIYQYRCSECNYATKYCHSLKLHLRKYSHKPAMVLNQDGTPNPLPIIDVYGTRRGPKTRHNPKESESSDLKRANSPQMSAQLPVYQNPFTTMGQAPFDFPYPYGQLLNSFPNIPNFMFNNNIEPPISPEKPKSAPAPQNLSPKSNRQSPEYLAPAPVDPPEEIPDSALDLTQMKREIQLPINVPTPATPTVSAKSRRKGRAFKLDRIAAMNQSLSSDDEHDSRIKIPKVSPTTSTEIVHRSTPICENRTIVPPVNRVSPPPDCPRTPTKTPEVPPKPAAKVSTETYECKYCEIAFRDPVLYTMHMGYHGYKDAFTCNMCGEECCDRISFFLHIARNSHV